MFFFFQAEDGIRDVAVTGVQTCALPIYARGCPVLRNKKLKRDVGTSGARSARTLQKRPGLRCSEVSELSLRRGIRAKSSRRRAPGSRRAAPDGPGFPRIARRACWKIPNKI